MDLAAKRERHAFNMECEEEADKMIKRGVAPWRAMDEARRIVELRRARGAGAKHRSRD